MSKERTYLPHTPECRERLTDLMRQDDRYRSLVEAADERQVMRVAEILDMKDEASRKQRKQQREERHRSADAGARGTGEAFGSQREDPGGPAHAGTRSTGGASGSQWFGVDRKRQADHQLQPDDCDGDGDCQMGITLAAEPPAGDRRKRRGDDHFPQEAGEPARQRSRLLSQSSITHWFQRTAHRQQLQRGQGQHRDRSDSDKDFDLERPRALIRMR